jgi:hypothetical protein
MEAQKMIWRLNYRGGSPVWAISLEKYTLQCKTTVTLFIRRGFHLLQYDPDGKFNFQELMMESADALAVGWGVQISHIRDEATCCVTTHHTTFQDSTLLSHSTHCILCQSYKFLVCFSFEVPQYLFHFEQHRAIIHPFSRPFIAT